LGIQKEIDAEIKVSDCKNAIRGAATDLKPVMNRWTEYADRKKPNNVRGAINDTLWAVSKGLEPPLQPDELRDRVIEPWIKRVLDDASLSVELALDNLHTTLVAASTDSSLISAATLIPSCAISVMAKFRLKATQGSSTFAFDDRQYFKDIQNLLHYYQLWQARGAHMIQEALMFRAQQAALSAWAANQAVRFFFRFSLTFSPLKKLIFFLAKKNRSPAATRPRPASTGPSASSTPSSSRPPARSSALA